MNDDLMNFTKCDIFTPDNISKIMISKLHNYGSLLEPSVGTGNLLKFINTKYYSSIDVYEIKDEYLRQIEDPLINKYNEDFIKKSIDIKYDNIIMNPPYIKMQDLSYEYRKYIKDTFDILKSGLIDIYYAFIIKCLMLLNDDGIMVAIIPNTYLYNKSALNLRKYLFNNTYIKEIIDFKDKKVFEDISVYCCITIFTKTKKDKLIYNDMNINYSDIIKNYSLFNLDTSLYKLKDICTIRNGIATLRDKIYIHNNKLFDENCWKEITSGAVNKFIIYPYDNGKIIDEERFKLENPLTYNYLLKNKEELSKRDKGNKTYSIWYAYGRTQSIKYNDKLSIYLPCFIDPANIKKNIYIAKNILHYSCLCIEPNVDVEVNTIIKLIIDNIDFISRNSTKRSAGWINISSRILYEIPLN